MTTIATTMMMIKVVVFTFPPHTWVA
jgi:hypothetical protein